MKTKISAILCFCLVAIIALAATASAMPITLNEVQLDEVELRQDQVTRLDVEKNKRYDVDVLIEAQEDIDDMEIKVFVSGFEYSLSERAEDHKGPFDMEAGEVRKFEFEIEFSDEFDTDNYLLRVFAMDRNDAETVGRYPITLDVPRNSLKIEDIIFYPETKVKGGQALMTSIRVENNGEKTQEDVKVKLNIPDFELAATTYINEIEAFDEKETEEIYLRMPKCGTDGLHPVEITVEYGEGHYDTTERVYVNFEQDSSCIVPEEATVELIIAENGPAAEGEAEAQELTQTSSNTAKIRKALEILLLVLVVLLVIIGLVIGFTRLGRNNQEEEY
ncbi:hypothetical protein KY338_02635 [Candidatus Woesearchaeota archaeon]|nr:hypothetical protein [Candidatus Woesearchaeota archaeon]MBW3005889.1 hypothetical protein [Candidatus Woesearchaeota archaeon]